MHVRTASGWRPVARVGSSSAAPAAPGQNARPTVVRVIGLNSSALKRKCRFQWNSGVSGCFAKLSTPARAECFTLCQIVFVLQISRRGERNGFPHQVQRAQLINRETATAIQKHALHMYRS